MHYATENEEEETFGRGRDGVQDLVGDAWIFLQAIGQESPSESIVEVVVKCCFLGALVMPSEPLVSLE